MTRFASIKSERWNLAPPQSAAEDARATAVMGQPPARRGKKAVSGYFSPELSRGLHLLALKQGRSLQSLMGEAFDDLMRKYGKHPFGER